MSDRSLIPDPRSPRWSHQRYAKEVAEGLHDKGAKKAAGAKGGKGRPRKVAEGQGELF